MDGQIHPGCWSQAALMPVTWLPGSSAMTTVLRRPARNAGCMTWPPFSEKAMHGGWCRIILAVIPGSLLPKLFYKENLPLLMYRTLPPRISFFMAKTTGVPVLCREKCYTEASKYWEGLLNMYVTREPPMNLPAVVITASVWTRCCVPGNSLNV